MSIPPMTRRSKGEIEDGKRYEEADFNKIIEIKEREKKRVEIFMSQIDQNEKTLVFCATQDHALAVRDLINQMKTSKDPNYCQRVTANDGALGEQHLRDFQDNEKTIPTILTTSQKLSTGVDARNIRNIVLMRPINSMIEFKQIIGRGTRLYDGKDYFTIYDFVKAYHHFSDPEWDGEPIEPETCAEMRLSSLPMRKAATATLPGLRRTTVRMCERTLSGLRPAPLRVQEEDEGKGETRRRQRAHHSAHDVQRASGTRTVRPCPRSSSWKCCLASCRSFLRTKTNCAAFWSVPDTRKRLLQGFAEKGFGREQLAEMQKIIDAEKSDLFDVLAYVAYALPPLTREERATRAKGKISTTLQRKQQVFLDFVLSHYVSEGVEELDQEKLTPLLQLKYHDSIADAVADLGKPEEIGRVFVGFQKYLYQQQPTA